MPVTVRIASDLLSSLFEHDSAQASSEGSMKDMAVERTAPVPVVGVALRPEEVQGGELFVDIGGNEAEVQRALERGASVVISETVVRSSLAYELAQVWTVRSLEGALWALWRWWEERSAFRGVAVAITGERYSDAAGQCAGALFVQLGRGRMTVTRHTPTVEILAGLLNLHEEHRWFIAVSDSRTVHAFVHEALFDYLFVSDGEVPFEIPESIQLIVPHEVAQRLDGRPPVCFDFGSDPSCAGWSQVAPIEGLIPRTVLTKIVVEGRDRTFSWVSLFFDRNELVTIGGILLLMTSVEPRITESDIALRLRRCFPPPSSIRLNQLLSGKIVVELPFVHDAGAKELLSYLVGEESQVLFICTDREFGELMGKQDELPSGPVVVLSSRKVRSPSEGDVHIATSPINAAHLALKLDPQVILVCGGDELLQTTQRLIELEGEGVFLGSLATKDHIDSE